MEVRVAPVGRADLPSRRVRHLYRPYPGRGGGRDLGDPHPVDAGRFRHIWAGDHRLGHLRADRRGIHLHLEREYPRVFHADSRQCPETGGRDQK